MLRTAHDRREVQRYVEAVRASMDAPELRETVARAASAVDGGGDPVGTLRARLPSAEALRPSSGGEHRDAPFLARDPMVSLLQSSLESNLRARGVRDEPPAHRDLLARIARLLRSLLHPVRYGPTDSEWVIKIAEATLERLADGNHPFNPAPAEHAIADDARVVVVGDWGTGLPRARRVAGFMAEEVAEALAQGRQAHVVHLGDVYYSGVAAEVERNVLAPGLWPVTPAQAAAGGVTSWSLNGNHDMYGGGYGYFGTLLADERFAAQRSADGKPTSCFRLTSPSWELVGLDTSWSPDVLAEGHVGVLQDPQAEYVASVAGASDRKLMLLSHHQLLSVYDQKDIGTELASKLAPTLASGRVTAWLWGHEHRCMGYAPAGGVRFPRCIGHGGVPVPMTHAAADPVPAPGVWEERGFLTYEGERWARFGFAILDFDGAAIHVRYRDDEGTLTRGPETIA